MADFRLVRVDDGSTYASLQASGTTVLDGLVKAYQLQLDDWNNWDEFNDAWKGNRVRNESTFRLANTFEQIARGSDEITGSRWDRYILRFLALTAFVLWPRGYMLGATPGGIITTAGFGSSPSFFDIGTGHQHPLFKPTGVSGGVVIGEFYEFGMSDAGDVPVLYGSPGLASVDVSPAGLDWAFTPTHVRTTDGPDDVFLDNTLIKNGYLVGYPVTADMDDDWRENPHIHLWGDDLLTVGSISDPLCIDRIDQSFFVDAISGDVYSGRGAAGEMANDWNDPYTTSYTTDDGWARLASLYVHGLHNPGNVQICIGSHYAGTPGAFSWRVVTREKWWDSTAPLQVVASGAGVVGTAFIQSISTSGVSSSGGLLELHISTDAAYDGAGGSIWSDYLTPYTLDRGLHRPRSDIYMPGIIRKLP